MRKFWNNYILNSVPDKEGEQGESSVDDFGYGEMVPPPAETVTAPVVETKVDDVKDKPVEKQVSGYDKEPEAITTPVVETKVDDVKLDYELDEKEAKAEDLAKVKAFAKKHGIPQAAAQELLDERKAIVANEAAEALKKENAIKQTRIDWHRELKTDPKFGGEQFAHNLAQAEKVIENFMPNVKKVLTERGSMLPPYVMRDLADLAKTLYGSKSLVQGDPPVVKDEGTDDALAFYE